MSLAVLLALLVSPAAAGVIDPVRASFPVLAPSAAPLDLSLGAGLYERRGVGLLVVDLKDSTLLHRELGNRKAHALVGAALDYAESTSSLFDGKVVRRLGDGYLVVFPTYKDALGAATRLQQGAPDLRARLGGRVEFKTGVHAGRVLVDTEAGDVFGAPVETALSLAAAADGGQIATEKDGAVSASAPRPVPGLLKDLDLHPRLSLSRFEEAAVMFAGLGGFSPRYARDGRRASHRAVKAFHALAKAAVERHGGSVVKTEGETVMAVFADRAAAGRAAREIAGAARARVGLTWGRVLREDRLEGADYFGNYVNSAARLMKEARDGEVVAGAPVGMAGGAPETVSVKGFDHPIPVTRVGPF